MERFWLAVAPKHNTFALSFYHILKRGWTVSNFTKVAAFSGLKHEASILHHEHAGKTSSDVLSSFT